MTDFEGQLRAAMESAVAREQPPGNLVERVRRRHRRHAARVAVAAVAVVAALLAAVSPTRAALLGATTRSTSSGPDRPGPVPRSAPVPPAAQYYGCDAQTYGGLWAQWRRGAAQAGPLWFINAGIAPDFNFYNSDGTLKAVPIIVMVRDNAIAHVQPTGAGQRYFRFLPGFNSTDHYTLRDGQAGATFAGCSDQNSIYGAGLTQFYIGILVAGPRCVTLEVRTRASKRPIPVTLSFGTCTTSK